METKTWDEVLSAARTIKEKAAKDVVPFWMNMGKATGEATSMQTYEMLLYGTGERLYDDSSSKWTVKSQGIMDALSFVDSINKEKLGPPLSKVLNGQAGNSSAREYLPKGKLGISLMDPGLPAITYRMVLLLGQSIKMFLALLQCRQAKAKHQVPLL